MSTINIDNERGTLVPTDLLDSNLFQYFTTLLESLNDKELVKNLNDVPVKELEVAVTEFIELIMFTATLENKHYYKTRLLRLKSVEKVLWEIEKYSPLIFNKDVDRDPLTNDPLRDPDTNRELLMTRYSPRLLKVAIKEIEISTLAENFLDIIENLFSNLLYFLEYRISIEKLIYNVTADINLTKIGWSSTAHKIIKLNLEP